MRPSMTGSAPSFSGATTVSQTMEPKPSIWAPSWILMGSPAWISVAASFSSVFRGV